MNHYRPQPIVIQTLLILGVVALAAVAVVMLVGPLVWRAIGLERAWQPEIRVPGYQDSLTGHKRAIRVTGARETRFLSLSRRYSRFQRLQDIF